MVIGRVERCAVANVEREGINYRIEMKVPGARVVRVLSARLHNLSRTAYFFFLPAGLTLRNSLSHL